MIKQNQTFSFTSFKDAGLLTAKHIRNTSWQNSFRIKSVGKFLNMKFKHSVKKYVAVPE